MAKASPPDPVQREIFVACDPLLPTERQWEIHCWGNGLTTTSLSKMREGRRHLSVSDLVRFGKERAQRLGDAAGRELMRAACQVILEPFGLAVVDASSSEHADSGLRLMASLADTATTALRERVDHMADDELSVDEATDELARLRPLQQLISDLIAGLQQFVGKRSRRAR